jgi:hypothetical protein
MALILNKSYTKLESAYGDEPEGWTPKLIPNEYNDPYGDKRTDPYMTIEEIIVNKREKIAQLMIRIYKDQAAREAGNTPLETLKRTISGPIFGTYFSDELLAANDIFKLAYDYVQVEMYNGWISDEIQKP